MFDRQENQQRREAVANAIATQRLEGLEIDPLTLTDLDLIAQGRIEPADALRRLQARVASGAFRDPKGTK